MDGKKLFIYGLFGLFGAVILSILSAVGGAFGAGTSLLVSALIGNVLIASLIGGAVAALAFHSVILGADKLFKKAADKEGTANGGLKPPSLASDKRYLWGSVSYFVTTVIGVNLCHALISSPAWFVVATIFATGLLGVLGLGAVVGLKLWNPNLKKQNDAR
jgi:hypothetical protein